MQINWMEIKDGFRGFEKLAVIYVKENFGSNVNWKKTQETRDGNKDAIAVFFSYSSEKEFAEWWMEAKYSNPKKTSKLTRFRIDSTIVSAILDESVRRVIFITNLDMNYKSMNEAKEALLKGTNCQQVDFILKQNIEAWLLTNQKNYEMFFPKLSYDEFNKLTVSESGCINLIEFYAKDKHMSFADPVTKLYVHNVYLICFNYYSIEDKMTTIIIKQQNLSFLDDTLILDYHILKGFNFIELEVKVNSAATKNTSAEIIKIDGHSIISQQIITYIPSNKIKLKIRQQFECESKLVELINSNETFHAIIQGESGSGKSYILDNLIKHLSKEKKIFFYDSFVDKKVTDAKIILNMVLNILFPYIPTSVIDEKFLNEINYKGDKYISSSVIKLLKVINSYEDLPRFINSYKDMEGIFTKVKQINERIVLLDNYQNLDDQLKTFFKELIIELKENDYPVSFILVGQGLGDEKNINELRKFINFNQYNLKISINDIIFNFPQYEKIVNKQKHNIFFHSVIELLFFIQYLNESVDNPSENEFLLLYMTFRNSNILDNYIINKFNKTLNASANLICNYIYYNFQPVEEHILENYQPELQTLLNNQLIKYVNNAVLPIHDLYKKIYCKHNKPQEYLKYNLPMDKIDKLRNDFYHIKNIMILNEDIKIIEEYFTKQKYNTIYYVLNILFNNDEYETIKYRLGDLNYFRLYYIYSMATANSSNDSSGYKFFKKLYNETKEYIDFDIVNINCLCLFEIINSDFEHMKYEEANNNINILFNQLNAFKSINNNPYYEKNIFCYLASLSIRLLIHSEQSTLKDKEFENYLRLIEDYNLTADRMFSILRFTLTKLGQEHSLVEKSLKLCGELVLKGNQYISKKQLLLFDLYNYYIHNLHCIDLKIFIELNDKLKNDFYNDYRRHFFVIAAIYYMNDNIDNGDQILYSIFKDERRLRERQEGIYYMILGMKNYLTCNTKIALLYLEKAKEIFSPLSSYVNIITHNINVIKGNKGCHTIRFYDNNLLIEKNTFYIDPRIIY